ncbi:MAG: outer membrane beta-barrel protein [Cyclobacteriaceae bacterium]|nr:outer membrane beta-barrel protein [Cyclobacteriaceae bacterium]
MKKLGVALAFIVCMIASYDSNAQKIGVMLGYGTDVEQLGLGVNGEFNINSKVSVAPSFVYWFVDNASVWEFNVNANYYFTKAGSADFYGLAGINLFNAKADGFDGESEVGLNLGAGANFNIGKSWEPFTEVKFVLGDADQLGLFFGAKFKLR